MQAQLARVRGRSIYKEIKPKPIALPILFVLYYTEITSGGDLVSTGVAKLEVHVEDVANLVNKAAKV